MKHTRDHVAKLAGVSSATVSRAFNNPELVSKEKIKKIKSSAKRINYVPDLNASMLRRSSSGIILFLEQPSRGALQDRYYKWFYADIIQGIKSVIESSMMFQLTLMSVSRAVEVRDLVRKGGCDGIICFCIDDPTILGAVKREGIPFVSCHHKPISGGFNSVYVDEISGGRIAGEELRRTGHVKPVHITGELEAVPACQERLNGFKSAFPGTHIKLINGSLGIKGGYASAKRIVQNIKRRRIDSIFVVNDLTAIGVIHALLAHGISIPKDVSVIGYDNLPFIDTLPFPLTTVDILLGEIYSQAAQMLIQVIKKGGSILKAVKPCLVKGESVKKRRL
ncbi:LacI family DNA-binding transcriptional regulator [Spirochaetota bacterium]